MSAGGNQSQVDRKMNLSLFIDLPHYAYEGESLADVADGRSKTRAVRTSLKVVSFECDEAVNECYRLEIVAAIDGGLENLADSFLMQSLALRVEWRDDTAGAGRDLYSISSNGGEPFPSGRARNFCGRVAECQFLGDSYIQRENRPDRSYYRFVVRPTFWFMSQARRIRTFLNSGVKDILKAVLDKYGDGEDESVLPVEYVLDDVKKGLDGEKEPLFDKRAFVLQYEESDLDFFTRWLERQGWCYFFDFPEIVPDGDGLMKSDAYREEVLNVVSENTLFKVGGGDDDFVRFAGRADSGLGLYSLTSHSANIPGQVVIRDYNPEDAAKKLEAKYPAAPEKNCLPPAVLEDESFASDGEGTALAKTRMEGLKCRKVRHAGRGNLPGLAPGRSYYPHSRTARADNWTNDAHLVARVKHQASAASPDILNFLEVVGIDTPAVGYYNNFESLSFAQPYHPERTRRTPVISQPVTGWVMPLDDNGNTATETGMYYVRIMGVENQSGKAGESGSAGPMRATAGKVGLNVGAAAVMQAGTEVILGFMDGNPDEPFVMSQIRNSQTGYVYNNSIFTDAKPDGTKLQEFWNYMTTNYGNGDKETTTSSGSTGYKTLSTGMNAAKSAVFTNSASRFAATAGLFKGSVSASCDPKSPFQIINYIIDVLTILADSVTTSSYFYGDSDAGKTASNVVQEITSYKSTVVGLLKQVVTFLNAESLKKQPSRFLMSVEPGSAALSQMAPVASRGRMAALTADYILEVLASASTLSKTIGAQVTTMEGYKESNAVDGWVEPYYYAVPAVVNVVNEVLDAVAFARSLQLAHKAETRLANRGLMISVFKKTDADNLHIKASKAAVPPVVVLPPAEGYDVQVHADGPILQQSDQRITLKSAKGLALKRSAPFDPLVADPAASTVGSIEVVGGNAAAVNAADQTSAINLNATAVNATGAASVSIKAGDNLAIGVDDLAANPVAARGALSIDNAGNLVLEGIGTGTLQFTGNVSLGSRANDVSVVGDLITLGARNDGILIGSLNANGDGIQSDLPQVAVNCDPAKLGTYLQKRADLDAKEGELIAKQTELENFDRDYRAANERVQNAGEAGPALADVTLVEGYPAQRPPKVQAVTAATTNRDTARQALEQQTQAAAGTKQLELSNGNNKAQRITLTANDLTIASTDKIIMQNANASKKLTFDLAAGTLEAVTGGPKFKMGAATIELA